MSTLQSYAGIVIHEGVPTVIHHFNARGSDRIETLASLLVLEAFVKPGSSDEAFGRYQQLVADLNNDLHDQDEVLSTLKNQAHIGVKLADGEFLITSSPGLVNRLSQLLMESVHYAFNFIFDNHEELVVNGEAFHLSGRSLLARLCDVTLLDKGELDRAGFVEEVRALYWKGFIRPAVGKADFGSFRRLGAICSDYGWTRGTPIDRYYLNKFISLIRDAVCGDVLEIGGVRQNKRNFGFDNAKTYLAVDLKLYEGVDAVADVSQRDAFPEKSFDAIVALNVLEHCESPQEIVNNIRCWLRPGGKVFCMVPNAQRNHPAPQDYWRPMPDAMRAMFKQFRIEKFVVYGNALTTIASLTGIAAEELTLSEMDEVNEYYPVATCVVAGL